MNQDADFVIIGGGTAGITLATRLTEDANLKVLVLEAGEDMNSDPRVITPALWPSLLGTDAAWNFTSVPQVSLCETVSTKYAHNARNMYQADLCP